MQKTLPDDCFDESGKRLKVQPEFSLKSIQEGRKNYKAYSFFFDKFVPLLEKKKSDFKGKLKTAKTDEDLITISSEAFGLLLLENHWDRWLDVYAKCGGRIGPKGGTKLKDVDSIVQPKYTRGGLKNGSDKSIGVGKGWSVEGILRFNTLIQQVKNDREDHSDFVTKWLAERNKSSNSRRQVSHVSPQAFAHWTLSEKESEGVGDKRNKEKMKEISKHFKKQSVLASVSSITSNVLPEPEGVDDKSNKEKMEEVNKNLKKQSDSDCGSSIGSKDLPEPKKIPSDEEQDMMEKEIKMNLLQCLQISQMVRRNWFQEVPEKGFISTHREGRRLFS